VQPASSLLEGTADVLVIFSVTEPPSAAGSRGPCGHALRRQPAWRASGCSSGSASVTPGRLILTGVILAVLRLTRPAGRALIIWVQGRTEVANIEATKEADIARERERRATLVALAQLKQDPSERPSGRLDRVRPPPSEIEPPTASSGY
jgi:hypothetical protein